MASARGLTEPSSLCLETGSEKTRSWDIYLPAVLFAYREVKYNSKRLPPVTFRLAGQSKDTYTIAHLDG